MTSHQTTPVITNENPSGGQGTQGTQPPIEDIYQFRWLLLTFHDVNTEKKFLKHYWNTMYGNQKRQFFFFIKFLTD